MSAAPPALAQQSQPHPSPPKRRDSSVAAAAAPSVRDDPHVAQPASPPVAADRITLSDEQLLATLTAAIDEQKRQLAQQKRFASHIAATQQQQQQQQHHHQLQQAHAMQHDSSRSDPVVKSESPDLSNSSAGSTPLFAPQPHSPSLHYDASAVAAAAAAAVAAGTGSGRGNSPNLRFHEQMNLGSASPPQRPARSAALQAQARQAARIKAEKEEEEEEDEEGDEEEEEEEESEMPPVRSPPSRSSTSGRSLMSSSRAAPQGDSSAAAASKGAGGVSSPVITGTGCGPIINGVRSKRGQGVSCHSCKTSKDSHALIYCQNKGEKGVKKRRCRKKYCETCLKRSYPTCLPSTAALPTWMCPSCLCLCLCASCQRRDAEKAAEKAAGGPAVTATPSPSSKKAGSGAAPKTPLQLPQPVPSTSTLATPPRSRNTPQSQERRIKTEAKVKKEPSPRTSSVGSDVPAGAIEPSLHGGEPLLQLDEYAEQYGAMMAAAGGGPLVGFLGPGLAPLSHAIHAGLATTSFPSHGRERDPVTPGGSYISPSLSGQKRKMSNRSLNPSPLPPAALGFGSALGGGGGGGGMDESLMDGAAMHQHQHQQQLYLPHAALTGPMRGYAGAMGDPTDNMASINFATQQWSYPQQQQQQQHGGQQYGPSSDSHHHSRSLSGGSSGGGFVSPSSHHHPSSMQTPPRLRIPTSIPAGVGTGAAPHKSHLYTSPLSSSREPERELEQSRMHHGSPVSHGASAAAAGPSTPASPFRMMSLGGPSALQQQCSPASSNHGSLNNTSSSSLSGYSEFTSPLSSRERMRAFSPLSLSASPIGGSATDLHMLGMEEPAAAASTAEAHYTATQRHTLQLQRDRMRNLLFQAAGPGNGSNGAGSQTQPPPYGVMSPPQSSTAHPYSPMRSTPPTNGGGASGQDSLRVRQMQQIEWMRLQQQIRKKQQEIMRDAQSRCAQLQVQERGAAAAGEDQDARAPRRKAPRGEMSTSVSASASASLSASPMLLSERDYGFSASEFAAAAAAADRCSSVVHSGSMSHEQLAAAQQARDRERRFSESMIDERAQWVRNFANSGPRSSDDQRQQQHQHQHQQHQQQMVHQSMDGAANVIPPQSMMQRHHSEPMAAGAGGVVGELDQEDAVSEVSSPLAQALLPLCSPDPAVSGLSHPSRLRSWSEPMLSAGEFASAFMGHGQSQQGRRATSPGTGLPLEQVVEMEAEENSPSNSQNAAQVVPLLQLQPVQSMQQQHSVQRVLPSSIVLPEVGVMRGGGGSASGLGLGALFSPLASSSPVATLFTPSPLPSSSPLAHHASVLPLHCSTPSLPPVQMQMQTQMQGAGLTINVHSLGNSAIGSGGLGSAGSANASFAQMLSSPSAFLAPFTPLPLNVNAMQSAPFSGSGGMGGGGGGSAAQHQHQQAQSRLLLSSTPLMHQRAAAAGAPSFSELFPGASPLPNDADLLKQMFA